MRYWSCTKLANLIRGEAKPTHGTLTEWQQWEEKATAAHPIRYWLAETLLNKMQDAWEFIPKCIRGVRYFIDNWLYHTHGLDGGLKRGSYHELDTRMLFGLFNELTKFVECELAWSYISWSDREEDYPEAVKGFMFRYPHCPRAGVDKLLEGAKRVYDPEIDQIPADSPLVGQPTAYSIAYQEIFDLYYWWKFVRPNRPAASKLSGWDKFSDEHDLVYIIDGPVDLECDAILAKTHKIEQQYDKEDEEMMIRLIKVRGYLWT